MEIERKFLIRKLPEAPDMFEHSELLQGYLSRNPVVRIRKDGEKYELTYKSGAGMAHEEANLPLSEESFYHLLEKIDGKTIEKTRYRIPYGNFTIELDIFHGHMDGLVMAEVEFESVEQALSFTPPDWFGEDVTSDRNYRNATMAYEM